MNNIEFISYEPTPEEQYMMGIATVSLYGKIILKFKIVEKKDGTTFFVAPANYRVADGGGSYKYIDAIMLDSRMEHEELMGLIRQGVNQAMNPQQQQPQSVHNQAPPQQNFAPDLGECPF